MRIFMQRPPASGEPPRFFQLTLQQDLFGGWTLVREWGQMGMRASSKRVMYMDQEQAEAALEALRSQQTERGFQVMFTRGADAPEGFR